MKLANQSGDAGGAGGGTAEEVTETLRTGRSSHVGRRAGAVEVEVHRSHRNSNLHFRHVQAGYIHDWCWRGLALWIEGDRGLFNSSAYIEKAGTQEWRN
uniref:Uncharacterized protein n=1 Tax=Rhizophora mucronata TaxID=61149 RepID=A0A2P2PL80_RHIMU